MIISHRLAAAAIALSAALSSVPVKAAEADFLNRFSGSFEGGGTVQRSAEENANQVTCSFTGQSSATGVTMRGKCGAFIFSKDIQAELRFNPETGRYSGTYVGSSIGPAALNGKRNGDSVVLTITWPQPVNGDTKATMTIRNAGNGRLAITITDKLSPGGPSAAVTRIALSES